MLGFARFVRVIEILGGIGLLVYAYMYGAGAPLYGIGLYYIIGAALLILGLLGFCILCPLSGKCTLFGNNPK
jgi:hypothetical protein